jgi:hypothetical protein
MLSAFLTATFAFPTVVFTVVVSLFVVYSFLKMVGFTVDAITDMFDFIGSDEGDGNMLDVIGVSGIPASIVIGISSIFAWMASFLTMRFYGDQLSGGFTKFLVLIGAAVVGFLCAAVVLRPFKPLFAPPQATSRAALVGKPCVIRSMKVDGSSGTAEIADGAAGMLVEVRCPRDNSFTVGSKAVVQAYDPADGTYKVGDPSWT